MKKSPLSTPSASRIKQSYGWKSHDNNRTGYGRVNSDNHPRYSVNSGNMNYANDFIPLNMSSPMPEQNRYGGNWYGNNGGRNYRNSCGYYNQRNNYHTTPKSHFNNSYSPYRNVGNKQFHGQKKVYSKGTHRQVDISRYIDVKSSLEDPWEELMRKFNDSKESEKRDSANTCSLNSMLQSQSKSDINTSVNTICEDFVNSPDAKMDIVLDSSNVDDVESIGANTANSQSEEQTNSEGLSNAIDGSSVNTMEELDGSPQSSSPDVGQQSI